MAAAGKKLGRVRKTTDEAVVVRCASGNGIIREEVWEDREGNVARFNLAFINLFLFSKDHGRVLGYDTAHGFQHRHFLGRVEPIDPVPYDEILARFKEEVAELRKRRHL